MTFTPTAEQDQAIGLYASGDSMAIEAGAGTGKSSTLRLCAESTKRRGSYVAFNRAIVDEAKEKMPRTVGCFTAHSLAFRQVGKQYAHRLGGARMKSYDLAKFLGLDGKFVIHYGSQAKPLQPGFLAGHAMRAVRTFCNTADLEISRKHIGYIEGIDLPTEDGKRTYANNEAVCDLIEPALRKAWADLSRTTGKLPFSHDCQPPGTLVRRVVRYGGGVAGAGVYEDVPIEQIREGDRVVSFTMTQRRGYVRRAGRRVTAAGQRDYAGHLTTVRTGRGRTSTYTEAHKCIVRLDADLADGNHVVYLARRGDDYRIGRTTWRTRSQGNSLGIRRRAESQGADAMWVLSVHASASAAALAEAVASHRFGVPTWQFHSTNESFSLADFWAKAGGNLSHAGRCAVAHGRDIRYPFWQRGDGWGNTRRPLVMRALNLLDGMLVLEPDEIATGDRGALVAYDGAGGWSPITITRSYYEGPVHNLDVEVDHTYIADGIATHNCYLRLWELGDPHIPGEFVLFDEAQDASPVMISAVMKQTDAQVVWVGDSQQAIYGWRGAENALASVGAEHRTFLTQSWRFGPRIAGVANLLLGALDAELRLVGTPTIPSRVGELDGPGGASSDAILCRTNARAFEELLDAMRGGGRAHLVGGGGEILRFARAAEELKAKGSTGYPDLACFTTWAEVQEYVESDPQGTDLGPNVKLIDKFGLDVIVAALGSQAEEKNADVIVSTAHKSKGREWNNVRLACDFPDEHDPGALEQTRLAYVAATRAKTVLDCEEVGLIARLRGLPWKGPEDRPAAMEDAHL